MLSITIAAMLLVAQRGNMAKNVAELDVKVISVLPLASFEGEAIRTHFDPRFVVALMLSNPRQTYAIPGSEVVLPTQEIAFFAIHSVTQLFMKSDIVGESFRIRVEMETVNGQRRYKLSLASPPTSGHPNR